MRLIVGLFATLTVLILGAYTFLFTSMGHGVLLPVIEGKIKDGAKLNSVQITTFDLSPSSVNSVILIENQSVKVNAAFNLFAKDLMLNYELDIKDLSKFQHLTNQKLKGTFYTKGIVAGKFDNLNIKGEGVLAKGNITYDLKVLNSYPGDINFNIKDLDIPTLLDMLNQPKYTNGTLNSTAKIVSTQPLKGDIVTTIDNGLLQHIPVKENFDIDLPKKPLFDLKADTNLDGELVTTKVDLNSFAAELDTKKSVFNIASGKFQTDYQAVVPDLSKLLFITKMPMRGDIKVNGDVTFDKTLLATFRSKKFGGNIEGKLDDTKLKVNTKGIKTLDLLHMMYYPQIFKSKLNLDLDYDTKTKKGIAKLDMDNGRFLMSDSIKMVNTVLGKDISLEVYEIADIDTVIDDTKLDSKLYFKSKNIHLNSDKLFVDTKKQIIDAKLNAKYKKYSVDLAAKGDIKDPKVKVDAKSAVKQKAKEKVVETIEKKLGGKVDENIKGIFNNFFK